MTRILIGLVGFFLALTPLSAQEGGLYGSKAPEDAAFVRILNSGSTSLPRVPVGAIRFERLESGEVSPYRVLSPGVLIIRARDGQADIAAGAGAYYTVVVSDSGPQVFQDRRHDDPLRAQIILYNLADSSSITLKTADGGTEVIPGVPPGESASIAVNAINADLVLFSEDEKYADIGTMELEAGQSYGIFSIEHSENPEVVVERAEVDAK
jgi:alginate O-acetyltransferase complex protein AlgF